jgi:hypothetical protein
MNEDVFPPIRTVTCHTPGCENEGVPLTLPCVDKVVCGPCKAVITDVKEGTE